MIATLRRGCNLVAIVAILALAACSPEIIYITAAEPEPEAAPAEEVEAAPVWQPEPWHIYVLDAAGSILYEELAQPESTYLIRCTCWRLTAEQHNLEAPDDPWRVVAGGMS